MGHRLGKDATFQIEDNGSTLRAIRTDLTSVTLSFTADSPEHTAFGDSDRQRLGGGLRDWSIDISGHWNDTATTGVDAILFGLYQASTNYITRVRACPGGSTAGYPVYTGSGILTGYNPAATVDGVVGVSATIIGSGSIVRSTL